MKFDSNLAWRQAVASVSANREVLLAMAGVFFLFPSLAFDLLFPRPPLVSGMGEEAVAAVMKDYYVSALPYVVPMGLVQAAGTLAMLTLFTDRRRPTVGQAIRQGLTGILPYLLAQILFGIAIGVIGGLLLALGMVTKSPVIIAVMIAATGLIVLYGAIKTSLAAPVIAVEGVRSPVAALRRSWELTRGNSLRIALFFVLVLIAFVVVMTAIMAVIGVVLALVAGGKAQEIVVMVLSSMLGAGMTLYFVAMLAAIHRQLAGPSPEAVSAPFE